MNIPLGIILFLVGYSHAGITPLSSDNQKTIDSNFEELALEVQRQSLKQGGIVTQNVRFSSSVYVGGYAVFGGSATIPYLIVPTVLDYGYAIVSGSQSITSGNTSTALAICASGKKVTGGGCKQDGAGGTNAQAWYDNIPDSSSAAWRCRFNNGTGSTIVITAYGVCGRVQ